MGAIFKAIVSVKLFPNEIQQEPAFIWTVHSVKCSTFVGMSAVLTK